MFRNFFGKQSYPVRRSSRPRVTLAVEALEERCLLDANPLAPPTRFISEADFRNYFVAQAVKAYKDQFGQAPNPSVINPGYLGGGWVVPVNAFGPVGAAVANPSAGPANSYTQTNNQVEGVDEGDLVKTDGQYLYVLSGQDLVILNAVPAGDLRQLSQTHFDQRPVALFLDGNHLTVISSSGSWAPASSGVTVTSYDVSDRTAPVLLQQTTLDGSAYVSARSIDGQLYVVVSSWFTTPTPQVLTDADNHSVYETEDQFRARVLAEPLGQLLPSYHGVWNSATGAQQIAGLVDAPQDVYRPQSPGDNQLLSVVRFDETGRQAGPATSVGVFGSSSTVVYASTENVYLVTGRGGYGGGETSEIDKVRLAADHMDVAAMGSVPGYAVNQFAIDESGLYLRIATSLSWMGPNNLYVLGQQGGLLRLVGEVDNFAPGERIYAVRFTGELAYVVTFRQTDPLFTIDLSDPTDPHIVGELVMPGFSLYLHMVGHNRLLGFGRDADTFGRTQGLELSLFDTSNLSAPTMVEHISFSVASGLSGWLSSPAEIDHHAFLFDPESGDIVIPVNQPGGGHLLVFHFDGDSTISYLGQTNQALDVERGLFIGGTLYSVAQDSVQAYDRSDLSTVIASVPLAGGPGQGPGQPFDYRNPNAVQFNEAWGSGFGLGLPVLEGRPAWPVQVVLRPPPAIIASAPESAPRGLIPHGVNVVATGSDAGAAPQVNVYNADTKALLFTLTPFDAHFTGGVRVAVGDVNGDGTPDIICAAGPGGGPNVVVVSGRDGSDVSNFMAFDRGFTGGVTVAAGDVNGDGYADIVCGADAGGGPSVTVFSGRDGAPLLGFFAYDPNFTGGVRVAVGDVTGTGRPDIICGAGFGGGPNVTVFRGTDGALLASFFAYDPNLTAGIYVAAGRVIGDGHAAIVTGVGPGGGANVATFVLSGPRATALASFFPYGQDVVGGIRVSTLDVGDGHGHVLGVASPNGTPVVNSFDALTGAAVDQLFSADEPGAGLFVAGMG